MENETCLDNFHISILSKYSNYDLREFLYTISSIGSILKLFKYNIDSGESNLIFKKRLRGFHDDIYVGKMMTGVLKDKNYINTKRNTVKLPITYYYDKNLYNTRSKFKDCPIYITGYGAYGSEVNTGFSKMYPLLLNKGVVIVLLHIRGGGENGLEWYKAGKMLNKINRNDIIIISDYAKGVVNKNFHSALIKKKCVTLIDPKNKPEFYKGAYLVKPNLAKFEEWCGKFSKLKAFNLMKKMKWNWLIVTCGSKGVYVFNKKGVFNYYKVKQIKKPNVIGSGDIFFAGLISLCLRAYDIFSSSEIASFASTKLVSRPNERFLKKNDFKKDLVFTNGVFDILHKGHLGLLKFSRSLGNKLVVAINSDESVKKIKGKNRPLNNIKKRIDSLKKTKLVDEIIVFKEKTPIKIIKKIRPDVIVKGDDYKFKEVSGKKISNVILFPKLKNISTTTIIEKFKLI